jgi:biotin carboxylase
LSDTPAGGRLLLLVPTTSYRIGDFLRAAGELGVEVAVGSNRRQVLEARSEGRTVTLDLRRPERGCRQIVDYAKRYPLKAVVGVDEDTCLLAAMASTALGLPHNSPTAVAAALSKEKQRHALAAAGLPVPEFRRLSCDGDLPQRAREQRYPAVLKPLSLSASRGVIRADDAAEFVSAAKRIAAILGREDGAFLVEEFIPGDEVALEGLLVGGRLEVLALFDKPDPLEGPFFEETIYVTPSRHPAALQAKIAETTAAACGALGLTEGPVHAELRFNRAGVWPIELSPRSIGGLCARSLSFGAGVALEDLVLRHALGLPLESLAREDRAAGVMMIPIPKAGRLRAVEGLAAARELAGIVDLVISIPLGQDVVPLPEGDRYLGFIFAKADDPARVEETLRQAEALLDFHID